MVLVNNSVPVSELGRVNGLGQALAAAARGVGPVLGGSLWSMSLGLAEKGDETATSLCPSRADGAVVIPFVARAILLA
eukprot:CAMPEP_0182591074 /NCGR_PEP_ID=MMETSP1324-20130603/72998_1 /TAXON_ID=236786 /ORGANISM="Florenciella sp., Strain RCC1587" /LENGTH=77 /DNA_ID=CAMNT_0024808341 /DNA_START=447 /DNA_END=676 /DNA_ORIENTATION=+